MEKLLVKFKELGIFMKIVVIAAILFVGSAVVAGIYDSIVGPEEKEVQTETPEDPDETDEPAEEEIDKGSEEAEEPEEQAVIVEYDEQFAFGEYTIEDLKSEIKDHELKLSFYWINQSGKDNTVFTALGYFDVMQGEEILKETSGAFDPGAKSDIFRRVDHGIMSPVTLTYGLVNDEPIEVRFGATNEFDDTKETLIIEIE